MTIQKLYLRASYFLTVTIGKTGTDTLMRVHPHAKPYAQSTKGISWHTDGIYFQDELPWLILWIPLDPCGSDAPGLSLISATENEVKEYSNFNLLNVKPNNARWNFWKYRDKAWDSNSIETHFQDKIISPNFKPEDLVMFSNWMVHSTYQSLNMTKTRSAIQLRLEPTGS